MLVGLVLLILCARGKVDCDAVLLFDRLVSFDFHQELWREDNGGWMSAGDLACDNKDEQCHHNNKKFHAVPGPCTLDVVKAADLPQDAFIMRYAFTKPVVIQGASDNEEFRELTRRSALLQRFGDNNVRLSSANTYSYEKRDVTFHHYCHTHHMTQPLNLSVMANESFYMFGDHTDDEWLGLLEHYNLPPYSLPGHLPMLSFGIAGPGTGVPFHFHGPGFAETIWGRKRWFLSPPDKPPSFNPNRTTLQWLLQDRFPDGAAPPTEEHMLECTLHPGEIVYFPDRWWHATLNIDASVFVSTFMSP